MDFLQDLYAEPFAHCYGCGRLNTAGLHVKSVWRAGEGVAEFAPAPHHLAMPGYVYGGLIASLVDCHGVATAAAASLAAGGGVPGRDETPRFVTASLQVDFRKPTPMGLTLSLVATPERVEARKVLVRVRVLANEVECATGRVIAVPLPVNMTARP
jgi:acyl-coenzyme A thioesterase PaaI-like protein